MCLKDLFQIPKMKKQISELKIELEIANKKVLERQENINQTNAYWKRRVKELTNKKK